MKSVLLVLFCIGFTNVEARTTPWDKYEDKTDAILTVNQKTVTCDQANLRLVVNLKDLLDPFNPISISVPFSTALDCYRMATRIFDGYSKINIVLLETGEVRHYYEPDCEPDKRHGCENKVFSQNEEKFIFIDNLKLPFTYDGNT